MEEADKEGTAMKTASAASKIINDSRRPIEKERRTKGMDFNWGQKLVVKKLQYNCNQHKMISIIPILGSKWMMMMEESPLGIVDTFEYGKFHFGPRQNSSYSAGPFCSVSSRP
jgi:hypothetical protein